MFFKLISFMRFCFLFNVLFVNGDNKNTTATYHESLIVREYLFVDDVVTINISRLKFAEDAEMTINVVIDKTLGYNIDPFYPFYSLRGAQQPHNLDASEIVDHLIDLKPTMFVFEIDFKTNQTFHLHLKPKDWLASSMVHLYPDVDSMKTHNTSLRNQVNILSQCNIAGDIFYNLSFVLAIESAKSGGLHVLSLNSSKEISTTIEVLMSGYNFSAMYYKVQFGLYGIISVLALIAWFRRYRDAKEKWRYAISLYLLVVLKLSITSTLIDNTLSPRSYRFAENMRLFAVLYCIFSALWIIALFLEKGFHWEIIDVASNLMIAHSYARFFEFNNMIPTWFPTLFWISKFTLVAHFVFFMVFVALAERKHQEKRHRAGTEDGNTFVQIRLYLISVIVLIVLAFHLVPASMIWLELPFNLFWMQFALEELLYMFYWWFIYVPYCNDAITNAKIMN